jgi:diguanylate cyclase (GGDEF)-like protein
MTRKRKLVLIGAALIAGGLVIALGGMVVQVIMLPLSIAVACWLFYAAATGRTLRIFKGRKTAGQADENPLPRQLEEDAGGQTGDVDLKVLGAAYSRRKWQEMELVVDAALDHAIRCIQQKMDINTVAIFFPTDDGGYTIRRFASKCEYVNPQAVIYPGVGVIGSFLKDGLKQLLLQDIVTDSMTLYYYTQDARIRSLMASPLIAGSVERGTIVVDSTEPRHFTDADHDFLTSIAHLCGETVYYAYLCNEHRLRYERLAAMSNIEKYFFNKLDIEAVLDKMVEIIPFAIPCDRLTISLKNPGASTATIRRAWGAGAEGFASKTFSIKEKTLAGLLYSRAMCFFRNFSSDTVEVRYADGEPYAADLASFLAFPIGVDECKGGILLESLRRDAFSDASRALLSRLVTSAGLAIEKIAVIEQAQSLATHDGLTGLNNHRQFQKLLREEITRSTRYNDPLSLVIGDIDFFKKINDAHGHPFGDQVLRGVGAALLQSIRDSVDIAARYGGEEFALILVKTGEKTAQETAERIRQKISSLIFHTPQGESIHVTMSFGIAVFNLHAKDIDGLVLKADKALYRAKQNGRDRVEVF